MKVFYVDIERIETKVTKKRYFIEAEDIEAARKEVNKTSEGTIKLFNDDWRNTKNTLTINPSFVVDTKYSYVTKRWQDVEDEYIRYVLRHEEAKANNEDPEDYNHILTDAKYYLDLAKLLEKNEFEKAYKLYCKVDTFVRDGTPERVTKLFDIIL